MIKRGTHNLRLDDETHELLALLAADRGLSMAAVVADLVKRETKRKPPTATKPSKLTGKRQSKWSEETVLEGIRARVAADKPINSWTMQLEDAGLWEGGCRVFGTWTAALDAAGIEPPFKKNCGQYAKGLKRLRLQAKLTQLELGQKSGLAQSAIANIEGEKRMPSQSTLVAISSVLRCQPEELLVP